MKIILKFLGFYSAPEEKKLPAFTYPVDREKAVLKLAVKRFEAKKKLRLN